MLADLHRPQRSVAREAPRAYRFTVDQFMRMSEDSVLPDLPWIELVDGALIQMPSEGFGHNADKMRTYEVLRSLASRDPSLYVGSGLSIHLEGDTAVGPDNVVIDRPTGRPSSVPAIAVRLAAENSWSTRRYDLTRKRRLYATAGVAEYWVLTGPVRLLHRFAGPDGGDYGVHEKLTCEQRVAVPFAPGETVAVADLFDLD